MRIFAERGRQIQRIHAPNSRCLCEIIPRVLLRPSYRVGVHWGVSRVCPSVQRALTAPVCTPLMPIKGSNNFTRCLLLPLDYATLAVNNDDGSIEIDYLSALTMQSDWFFLVLVTFWQINSLQSADKDQQEMHAVAEKPHDDRCRCKIRYVSKCTAASRGPPCDSAAFCLRSCRLLESTPRLWVLDIKPPE